MANPFLGEIRIFTFGFAPTGWAMCNGQLLPINQNQALFALLGTTYGGNGATTFALPNLQGRVPFHLGSSLTLGQTGGEESHMLVISELPAHTHVPVGSSFPASVVSPQSAHWAVESSGGYAATQNGLMNFASIVHTGGSQSHDNMSPYLALNFCIALQGIFPTQN